MSSERNDKGAGGSNWGPKRRPRPEPGPGPEPAPPPAPPEPPFGPNSQPVALQDAVVGWLVIVGGPGKGADFRLQAGMNSIGRGPKPLIDLAFDDPDIQIGVHCRVTFDPRSKNFFLSPGDSQGLTYVSNQTAPVLTAVALEAMQDFEIGSTKIRFVPFCGPSFVWLDF